MSKIVILDGYAANPGDISWEPLNEFGEVVLYDRTPAEEIIPLGADQSTFEPLPRSGDNACCRHPAALPGTVQDGRGLI